MTGIHPDILDLAPILPPRRVDHLPEGDILDLEDITRQARMLFVVTPMNNTEIRRIAGNRDLLVTDQGYKGYGIARDRLPEDSYERAREIIRRLAYGFHDWAAREIAARYHRDLKQT
ncbi:MAG: hypothetical protein OXE94_07340 [Aestuariivita sp.]|nr:hypothetical protein [Aestuariivita sp.]MCY4202054.1 hypothetical protein [Aestuariivita sp.]